MKLRLLLILAAIGASLAARARADVAFLAAPRTGGKFPTQSLSENWGPYIHQPAAQLVIRRDGEPEFIAIPRGVQDVRRSRDGKSLLVTLVEGYRFRDFEPPAGQSDIYRYVLATHELIRLTNTPEIWECQPGELPDGTIGFLSNEDNWQNPHEAYRAFTLYAMREDGTERKRLWHAGLGGVFGWSLGGDGWIYFASGENQGYRGARGNHWPLWKIRPDGSGFEPVLTQIGEGDVCDWAVQTSSRAVVFARYYDTRIYGWLGVIPRFEATPFGPPSKFGDPRWTHNPGVALGDSLLRLAWEPVGMYALTQDGIETDHENSSANTPWTGRPWGPGQPNRQYGMFSHPTPIPGNGVLYTWTGDQGDAAMNLGVCVCENVAAPFRNDRIVKLVDRPDRHEWMATPICSDEDVYGAPIPNLAARIDERLPAGSPLAFVGSSSVDRGEFVDFSSDPWKPQLIEPDPESIHYVRLLGMQPTLYGRNAAPGMPRFLNGQQDSPFENWEGLSSEINERVGVYAEIPVSKWGETADGPVQHYGPHPPAGLVRIRRADGRFDTSWGAYLPADQPWSLQLLNEKKEAIVGTTAQTWHQGVSREWRGDCQGCHNHHRPDQTKFEDTLAGQPGYAPLKALKLLFTTRDDLPASIPSRPWAARPQPVYTYHSALTDLDDNPAFTVDEQMAVRRWIDTGMMEGPGAETDTMEPTLVVAGRRIGALDPHSGLKSLTVDGQDVTALIDPETFVYAHPAPWPTDRPVTFAAEDHAGRRTTLVKKFGAAPETDDGEAIRAELAAAKARVAELESQPQLIAAERDELKSRRAEVNGLSRKITELTN